MIEISKKISRIGANYNQVVKKYNASCLTRKKNGDPVINSKATIFYIEKLKGLTQEVYALLLNLNRNIKCLTPID